MSRFHLSPTAFTGISPATFLCGSSDSSGSSALSPSSLSPFSSTEWSPDLRRLRGGTHDRVAELQASDVREPVPVRNLLRRIAPPPDLLEPFPDFATTLAQQALLPRRDSEIQGLSQGTQTPTGSEEDRALLRADDQLRAEQQPDEDSGQRLAERFSGAPRVEVAFGSGFDTMRSVVTSPIGVELEPGLGRLPVDLR